MSDECFICGTCWWTGCQNDADYTMDVELKRHGRLVYSGKVDLCAGHTRFAGGSGSLNIGWAALEQALARQHVG